tara:strand:- start:54 stop:248 length:195 start_codon:yes stop_codon:yes gene_type:complete
MKVKVHWILDGIAEIEADDIEAAEQTVHLSLEKLINENEVLTKSLGAKAIQGKGYLPGSSESND